MLPRWRLHSYVWHFCALWCLFTWNRSHGSSTWLELITAWWSQDSHVSYVETCWKEVESSSCQFSQGMCLQLEQSYFCHILWVKAGRGPFHVQGGEKQLRFLVGIWKGHITKEHLRFLSPSLENTNSHKKDRRKL